MEAQMSEQTMQNSEPAKPSFWKTKIPYAVPVLVLIALAAYGYSNGWLKQVSSKASEVIATTLPAMVKTSSAEDALTKARAAFAAGDVNAAVENYRKVIAKNPADVAPFGELGNVYYSIDMRADAAGAYFDAASKAIEQNQLEIAEALLPVISEGNPMLAAQLNDMLFNAQVKADMAEFSAQAAKFEQMQQPMQQFHQPMQQPMQQPFPQQS